MQWCLSRAGPHQPALRWGGFGLSGAYSTAGNSLVLALRRRCICLLVHPSPSRVLPPLFCSEDEEEEESEEESFSESDDEVNSPAPRMDAKKRSKPEPKKSLAAKVRVCRAGRASRRFSGHTTVASDCLACVWGSSRAGSPAHDCAPCPP